MRKNAAKKFDPAAAARICQRLKEGDMLELILEREKISMDTLKNWVRDDGDFAAHYVEAAEACAEWTRERLRDIFRDLGLYKHERRA